MIEPDLSVVEVLFPSARDLRTDFLLSPTSDFLPAAAVIHCVKVGKSTGLLTWRKGDASFFFHDFNLVALKKCVSNLIGGLKK